MFFAMPEDFTSLKKYPVYTLKIYPSVQSFPFHKQPPGSFPTLPIVCRCWKYSLQRFRLWCMCMKLLRLSATAQAQIHYTILQTPIFKATQLSYNTPEGK